MNSFQEKYKRLIIVAYRLPFTIRKTEEGVSLQQNSGGLVSAILSMAEQMGQSGEGRKINWVGHCDPAFQDLTGDAFENETFEAHPVFMDPEVHQGFYEGFCNDMLWPLLHYFPTYASFRDSYFEHYEQANTRFFEELVGLVQPGDLVWIHDFQLMLLPAMLRKAVPDATIGYFFHVPFPTNEIFKLLPRTWRQALLEGLLGADVVGFHTPDYSQHFIRSVWEVLSLPVIGSRVILPERSVVVRDFPISVDFNKFDGSARTPEVVETKTQYRNLLRVDKIIFSVDRLDYAKGIKERLQGYERFLTQNPDWNDRVSFVMTVVPSRDQVPQYQEIKREIEETVGRINGLFGTIGWRPIVYSYLSLKFQEMMALYTTCDVALITPIRDGMNLVAKEFIASRYDEKGVLILSELAGAAQELKEALIINPTDTQEVANAIYQALHMSPEEQTVRMRPMRVHLQNHNVFRWAVDFLNAVDEAVSHQPDIETSLPLPSFSAAFKSAENPLLLLDFDGTLAPIVDDPAEARLSESMATLIRQLTETSDVAVISGRDRRFLEQTFATIPVHIVAEHGAFYKAPDADWKRLDLSTEDWVAPVRALLDQFIGRHRGTFMEEKETAIAWHYRKSGEEDIEMRAMELAMQLRNLPSLIPLTVIQGSKVVEVKPALHSKGTVARSLFEQKRYDFVVSIGDDTTDEDMFRQLPDWAYSVRIGAGESEARYRLARQQEVLPLLELMLEARKEEAVKDQ
ncbi:bifunctional alpha,alpha-trehalose-phosphate synthase (UDP-forming)/trehalose-phosphatase [Larkinella soli]|uniref:bifunctional alpha,alpha-trehalose-phosphate synthase (UDP-forming)/trehalose-phosphatase n=1 Tax=Larkinella soli TaxID=1770527 RepID=UPI000FFBC8D7|nr:bifunctional alpha,alpha-trehalose-phosphate synthase (UDP-forming)/trehalose-phosphatase [Larkinella soli]